VAQGSSTYWGLVDPFHTYASIFISNKFASLFQVSLRSISGERKMFCTAPNGFTESQRQAATHRGVCTDKENVLSKRILLNHPPDVRGGPRREKQTVVTITSRAFGRDNSPATRGMMTKPRKASHAATRLVFSRRHASNETHARASRNDCC
jgi:hypothetical protein